MATKRESDRPLFHRMANREAVNFKASEGKRVNSGNNVLVFAGEIALNNPLGTYWPAYDQTGALQLTVGEDAEIGGADYLKITANGAAITLDPAYTWNNVGSTAISTTAAAINVIVIVMVSATEINYSVKVL